VTIGTKSDFKIYHEEFFAGMVEVQEQNVAAFNAASRNGIRLVTRRMRGDYEKESFMKKVSSLISRRDVTSVSSATDLKLEQSDVIGVKINRKIGPVAQSKDAFRKISEDPRRFSYFLGQQWAPEILADQLNTVLAGAEAALSFSGWPVDKTGESTKTMTTAYLVDALNKMGDRAGKVVCWVMHSKPYHDLVKEQIAGAITNVADVNVATGAPITLGRPVVVTDSSYLTSGSNYQTLGLVADGLEVAESEERDIVTDEVTGLENLVIRIQGEFAYNLRIKGFQWDTTNGGVNPTIANISTQGNWDKVAADDKSIAGVYLRTQ
jgi:hypothetical protein